MAKSLKIRSWFIVDPSAKAATVHSAGADVVVLDLTDVPESRNAVGDFCRAWADLAPAAELAFLLPAFSSARTEAAIDLAIRYRAASVVLPGARSGAEVQRLDMALRVAEIRAGLAPGKAQIVALADAAGILAASSFARCSNRLAALGWEGCYDPSSDTARLAAGTIALTAAAAGIAAVDAASPAGDAAILLSDCERARANGFSGKLCRSSDQVPIVNRIFSV
ncbi:Citrate lyase beta subunit [Neorhizobium galegae bv. orientalis]|nr:Citrate lyase beta subunit [Neorhizobium galegae bv. orientalis]